MSTKTTFKRIALVTVAALGFGLLTVTPSTATVQQDTLAITTASMTWAAGSSATVTNTITQTFLGVQSDTMTVTGAVTSAPSASTAVPQLSQNLGTFTGQVSVSGYTSNVTADGLTGILADSGAVTSYRRLTAVYTVTFALNSATIPTAGTYVFTFTPYNMSGPTTRNTSVAPTATAVTWTLIVPSGTVMDDTSTSKIRKISSALAAGSTEANIRSAATGSAVATITSTPLIAGAASTGSTNITVTIAGPGSVNLDGSTTVPTGSRSASITTGARAGAFVTTVFGDGTTGTTVVTVVMGSQTYTHTLYFYGAAASVTAVNTASVIDSGSAATSTAILTATVKDANGNVVPGATVYAVSGTTTVFASTSGTTGSAGTVVLSVLGLTAGTSAVTVQNVATGSTATFSAAAVSIRAGDDLASSVTMSLDKTSYIPGELAVLTLTILDAAGNAVADEDTQTLFGSAGVTSSRAITGGSLPAATVTTSGSTGAHATTAGLSYGGYGVTKYAFNVPSTSGAFTLSATSALTLTSGSTLSITATVGKSANEIAVDAAIAAATAAGVAATAAAEAATDAATEAIDAANAATDSANAAAEAADAATAAAQQAGEDAVAAAEAAQAAAVDAAAEATEAANAATDAANAAAESADAATAAAQDASDAVAALSTQVATLISGLKAQLTALTNLVIKIQKKVKA